MSRIKRVFHTFFKSDLLSGAAVYVLGNVLQKAAAFLLIPLYTYYLSPEDFGITGIVQSVSQILVIVLALGINAAVQRYYYDYYQDDTQLRRYISSTFLFLTIAASVVSLGLFLAGKFLWEIFFRHVPFVPYAQLMIWAVWGNVLNKYALNLYRARQEPVRFVVTQIGKFLLTATATIYFVAFCHLGAKGQLFGLLIGSVVTAFVSSILLLKEYFTLQIDWKLIRVSMIYGVPLIPHLIAQWVKTSLDRVILENYTTLAEVGLYTLGYKLGFVMEILVSSVNYAYVPYFFEMMKTYPHPRERFKKITAVYAVIFSSVCLWGGLFGHEIVQLIAPSVYYPSAKIIPLILFGFLINGYYFLFVNPLFYFEKTSWLPWLTGLGAVVSVGLNFVLIPRFGALGAAWSLVISIICTFILTFFASRKVWKVDLHYERYLLLNILVGVAAVWMTYAAETVSVTSTFVLKLFIGGLYVLFAYMLLLREYEDWFVVWLKRSYLGKDEYHNRNI